MNKLELVNYIASAANLPRGVANRALEAALSGISEALLAREKVVLIGFGVLAIHDRVPQLGRDPVTGDTLTIKPKKLVSFKPAKALQQLVEYE